MVLIPTYAKKNTIYISSSSLEIQGPKGNIVWPLPQSFIYVKKSALFIPRKYYRMFLQTLANLLTLTNKGWHREISIKGRGFKLFKFKDYIAFDLGYSNLFLYKNNINNISLHSSKQKLIFSSVNKSVLGDIIHKMKKFYKLDRYHSKGLHTPEDKPVIYKKLM